MGNARRFRVGKIRKQGYGRQPKAVQIRQSFLQSAPAAHPSSSHKKRGREWHGAATQARRVNLFLSQTRFREKAVGQRCDYGTRNRFEHRQPTDPTIQEMRRT